MGTALKEAGWHVAGTCRSEVRRNALEALGFDAADLVQILRETPATSAALEAKGEKMAKADYEPPQARLAQHLKDVRLIRQLADRAGANTPLRSVHQSLLGGAGSGF